MQRFSYFSNSLLVILCLLCAAPTVYGQGFHDQPWKALPLYDQGTFTYGAVGATPDADPFGAGASCTFGGPSNDGGNSTWAVLRPRFDGTVTLDTDGSDFDTIMIIMTTSGSEIACNDDDPNNPSGDFTSRIENVSLQGDTDYFVRITGYDGDEGNVAINITNSNFIFHPYNEYFHTGPVGGALVDEGTYFNWNNNAPPSEPGGEYPTSCTSDSESSVWYSFTPPASADYRFETIGDGEDPLDTVMNVWSTANGSPATEIACNDDGGEGRNARIVVSLQADQLYYVRVSSWGGATPQEGPFFLEFSQETTTDAEDETVPSELTLGSAYPNPFFSRTTLPYVLPEAQDVRIVAYDVLGREVAVLAEGIQPAGEHEATFDAASLPSGMYVIRLTADKTTLTRRVTVVR